MCVSVGEKKRETERGGFSENSYVISVKRESVCGGGGRGERWGG